jgi:hypothetical protein
MHRRLAHRRNFDAKARGIEDREKDHTRGSFSACSDFEMRRDITWLMVNENAFVASVFRAFVSGMIASITRL